MDQSAFDKIKRNMMRLMLNEQPFFGVLLGHLKFIEIPHGQIVQGMPFETMATDGVSLYYSAPFVHAQNDKKLQGVLVHEVLHIAFEHNLRRKDRDHVKWNIACDFVINLVVLEAGMELPDGGCIDNQYASMTSEEVYNRLPDMPPGGSFGFGGVLDGAPMHDEAKIAEMQAENKIRLAGAAAVAKKAGKLPDSLRRLIDELTEPKVDWAAQFRNLVTSLTKPDYSFSRPNRRYMHSGLYLPGYVPDAVGHVAVAIDTSGSIWGDPKILTAFASEVKAMFDEALIEKITVIWADAEVQHHQIFENGDELIFEPKGGGGTAFSDTFRWIDENCEDVAMTVYLTDLYVSDFGEEPAHPVVWAVYGTKDEFKRLSPNVPFGDCIYVDPD